MTGMCPLGEPHTAETTLLTVSPQDSGGVGVLTFRDARDGAGIVGAVIVGGASFGGLSDWLLGDPYPSPWTATTPGEAGKVLLNLTVYHPLEDGDTVP